MMMKNKKQNIRKGVFETNSSSTHSVHIDESVELLDTIVPDENGIITLNGDEFGWEVESYNDSYTKANYLAVLIHEQGMSKYQELFESVIKEHTGAKEVKQGWNKDDWCYVDHGSEHGIIEQASESRESMRNYLFNKNSWLFTTNDNDGASWMIDKNGVPVSYND